MDYKTTALTSTLETNDNLLPEIEGLHFGVIGNTKAVFDYTAYFEENGLTPIDYKVFMRINKPYIEVLAKPSGNKTSELFYLNTNGHILVAGELVFLFLAFANPDLCIYFNALIRDVITDGVAYSNGFIYSMAAERMPSDALTDIINDRNTDEPGGE